MQNKLTSTVGRGKVGIAHPTYLGSLTAAIIVR